MVLSQASLEEAILATPAICGETLYIRSAPHLWAFGAARGAMSQVPAEIPNP